ncbi:peptidase, partial [Streptomyces sp. SID10362]|nr:peptidase [Streptomyces sp. SID10362]
AEVLARAAVEPHAVLARVESHFEPTP